MEQAFKGLLKGLWTYTVTSYSDDDQWPVTFRAFGLFLESPDI